MVITHNDLDGIGCPLIASAHPFIRSIDYVATRNPEHASKVVQEIIITKLYKQYDRVYITDISVDLDTASLINESEELCDKLKLLDHHKTALWLNVYNWAKVKPVEREINQSGTSLLFNDICEEISDSGHLSAFSGVAYALAETIRSYDTWDWKEEGNQIAVNLNDLFFLIGKDEFMSKYRKRMFSSLDVATLLREEDKSMLKTNELIKTDYIKNISKNIKTGSLLNHKVGIVFADKYISELGNYICENNPELDLAVIIDMQSSKMSYRTVKDDVDVSAVASKFGGGGHPKASGSMIKSELIDYFLHNLFD